MTSTAHNFDDFPISLKNEHICAILGISRAAAYQLMRSKGFPTIRIGKRMVVPRDKFIIWMEQQTPPELQPAIQEQPSFPKLDLSKSDCSNLAEAIFHLLIKEAYNGNNSSQLR